MALHAPSYKNIKWSSVGKAAIFSFISGFLGFFAAAGGFSVDAGWAGAVSLIGGGVVSGINVAFFAAYQTFESKDS